MKYALTLLCLTLGLAAAPSAVRACNLPTFRYGLEQWQPHAYEVLVYYDGSLPSAMRAAIDELEQHPLNLTVWLIDIQREGMHEELEKVWMREKDTATLPWVVLRFPHPVREERNNDTVWSGSFDNDALQRIVDSPARRKIAEHILSGVSIVWVFVDGAEPAQNKAKLALLNDRLAWIKSIYKLPEAAVAEAAYGQLGEQAPGFVPLKMAFEILRLQRNLPEEQRLLDMLLALAPDSTNTGAPALFAVYGQGRLLPALVGDGISEESIDTACFNLLNTPNDYIHADKRAPGADLLIQADWFGGVSNLVSVASEAPTLVGALPSEDHALESPASMQETASRASPARAVFITLIVLLAIAGIVTVKILARTKKS